MRWSAKFAETAVQELNSMPLQLQSVTLDRIELLEVAPSEHSRVCPPIPGPPNCMVSGILQELDGRWWYIRILFRFMPNETELFIIGIGVTRYAERPDADD